MYQFIEPELSFDSKTRQPASYVRSRIRISKAVRSARLEMTALGVYIGFFNGERLTEEELLPGFTDYRHRVQVQSYDVTDRIQTGENVMAAVIGDGWYRGGLGAASVRNQFGKRLAWMCRLSVVYQDGTEDVFEADSDTRATQNGPVGTNDNKIGEEYDARKEMPGWNAPGYDDSGWHGVKPVSYTGQLIEHEGEPILRHESFSPFVISTPNGETVLDFGQNMMGRMRFRLTAKAGDTVTLTFGETLDENGNFTLDNLNIPGAGKFVSKELQKLVYTCKAGEQEYEPQFLICGFRYVRVEGWPEAIRPENFKAFAIYSDLPETGSFSCSNEKINRFVQNVRWSQKSNFVDIPTDCPTRERAGWTADISIFAKTACYLTDTRKFLRKWMRDYRLEQLPDGNLPFVVPTGEAPDNTWGCMGWSNALANVAMTLYAFYGDQTVLEEVYDAVRRFVDFNVARAKKNHRLAFLAPRKDRELVIDTGFHFGEWLEPGSSMPKDFMSAMLHPDTELTTAWFYLTALQLSQMAALLGKSADAQAYGELAKKLKAVYRARFLKAGGVRSKRQCKYVRPLAMGLADSETAKRIAADLNKLCEKNRYRIGTGFLTTWQILDVLADHGYLDTAYRVLENEECPGWLYTVSKGATTTWENWLGIDQKNHPKDSLNHYAMGACVSWLYSHCAGIRPLKPGFEEILIKPMPGGTLTEAKAEYRSVVGSICSHWRVEDGVFLLTVSTPEGRKVRVELPDGRSEEFSGGTASFRCLLDRA